MGKYYNFENVEVFGWNALTRWLNNGNKEESDSTFEDGVFVLGENDFQKIKEIKSESDYDETISLIKVQCDSIVAGAKEPELIDTTYASLRNDYSQMKENKELMFADDMIDFIESLPYSELITGKVND